LFRGWTGDVTKGEPAFIELSPRLEQEPGRSVSFSPRTISDPLADLVFKREFIEFFYLNQKLNRTLICPTRNTQAVTSQLPSRSASISINVVSESGGVESRGYGDDWTLLGFDETSFAPGFSRITAVYERTVNQGFELDLPQGFTITCANGVGSFNWLGQPLEQFDSGTGVCGSGFKVEPAETRQNGQRFLERNDPFQLPRQVQTPGYFLVVNGVSFEEFYPKLPEIQRDYYELRAGPFLTESEARGRVEDGLLVLNSSWFLTESPFAQSIRSDTKAGIEVLFDTGNLRPWRTPLQSQTRVSLWGIYEAKTDFFVSGGSGPGAVNSDGLPLDLQSLGVKWVVENNKIKLKVGDSVWKQYELPEDDS
jgi:hypothetical protein